MPISDDDYKDYVEWTQPELPIKMEEFRRVPYEYQCSCGCNSFNILEDGYECISCEAFHSFDQVHGNLEN